MLRSLKTAIRIFKERGANAIFWLSIRKIYYIRFSKQQEQVPRTNKELPPAKVVGVSMYLHPSMKGLSEVLYLYGTHEPLTTQVYLENVQPGDHVLEIGANLGYYVLLARSKVGTSGRVLGFEPVPDNFVILRKNVEHYKNIEILESAVGNETGYAEFHVSEIPNWGSLLYTNGLRMEKTIKIQVTKLDDFLSDYEGFQPTMIHMDIEGGELAALDGMWQTIAEYKPQLLIEFHPFSTGFQPVAEIFYKLIQLGYQDAVLIDRLYDEPWLPNWLRRHHIKNETLEGLIDMMHSGNFLLNFSLLVKS